MDQVKVDLHIKHLSKKLPDCAVVIINNNDFMLCNFCQCIICVFIVSPLDFIRMILCTIFSTKTKRGKNWTDKKLP